MQTQTDDMQAICANLSMMGSKQNTTFHTPARITDRAWQAIQAAETAGLLTVSRETVPQHGIDRIHVTGSEAARRVALDFVQRADAFQVADWPTLHPENAE